MALEIEYPPSVPRAQGAARTVLEPSAPSLGGPELIIGLINNMPDSALEGTEAQFGALLGLAAGTRRVRLRFSSIPEVPRGEVARARIESSYWRLDDLLSGPLDALIVTGTEPKAPVLSDEPYWRPFTELLEFADRHLVSSIWSCLAAHGAVLHLDQIQRRRLAQKRSGVYTHSVTPLHPLVAGLPAALATPHSRWNELDSTALEAAGYEVLSGSSANGADAFIKRANSLLVFFQGHPEYEDQTLLKEFRRDVGRFLSGEHREYPRVPAGYFGPEAQGVLDEFERRAVAAAGSVGIQEFPYAAAAAAIQNVWTQPAVAIYRNWLDWVANKKQVATGDPVRQVSLAAQRRGDEI